MYQNVQTYLDTHHNNRGILDPGYLDLYDSIMESDLCQTTYVDQTLLPLGCSTLFSDAPTHVSCNLFTIRAFTP